MNTITAKHTPLTQTRTLVSMAMLTTIAYLLAFLEFPVPLTPSFAMMDLSDLPALIGAMSIGPGAGVAIELVKNALQLLGTATGGVGELANFLIGASFVFTAGTMYHKVHWKGWQACALGAVVMAAAAALANYFILFPMFNAFMPMDQIIAMFGELIPFIHTKLDIILFNTIPFNLIKGLAIALVTLPVYGKLAHVLKTNE